MYEKQQLDPRQLGQALAADYVATGTVQRTGERFRVSPQLVRFSDGSIWGEHYDLPRSELLSLESAAPSAKSFTAATLTMPPHMNTICTVARSWLDSRWDESRDAPLGLHGSCREKTSLRTDR